LLKSSFKQPGSELEMTKRIGPVLAGLLLAAAAITTASAAQGRDEVFLTTPDGVTHHLICFAAANQGTDGMLEHLHWDYTITFMPMADGNWVCQEAQP
jgi:hypothetical protein